MFAIIKEIFIVLLRSGSNDTKCVLLSNQKCMSQPTLINLNPSEYSQEFHYCSTKVNVLKYKLMCWKL